MTDSLMPTLFLSHGGGPWPYMEGEFRENFHQLEASLRALPSELPAQPRAILMVSAHWQTAQFSLMSSPQPGMVYDYGGFPDYTYRISYPAPGEPQLAQRVQQLLAAAGIEAGLDAEQGFDHGAFAPLAVMYPDARVPVVQLSIRHDYDPQAHIDLGRALSPLRAEGVLIIGSGLSYHNLRNFGPAAGGSSRAFDGWLQNVLLNTTGQAREAQLLAWEQAPSAREAHPDEDHLIPLMVTVGAAYDGQARCIYHEEDFFGGITVSSFRFD